MRKPNHPANNRTILSAGMIGSTIEFYDYYIYSTAAGTVIGPLFFPSNSPSAQLLAAFISLALAFVARPLGAIAFGHFGDRIGRKSSLVVALMMMGISTVLIACLPTYGAIGWIAPALLCALRCVQGFGLGGEWSGAALLAVENAPRGWAARFGMVPQLGAPVGYILACGAFLLLARVLTPAQFLDWGWRVPFVASAPLVLIGLWVRSRITEPAAFLHAARLTAAAKIPIVHLARHYLYPLVMAAASVIAGFGAFYVAGPFALGYGTTALGYSHTTFLLLQLGAVLFFPIGIIVSGILSDRIGAAWVLAASCPAIALAGAMLRPLLSAGAPGDIFLILAIAFGSSGFAYGALPAYLSRFFPARVRYSGTAMAFNLGGVVGGGLTPPIAQALAIQGGLGDVGLYLAGLAAISLLAITAGSAALVPAHPASSV